MSRAQQITDARAPFESIDTALSAGEEHLRALGWSLIAMVAEEQTGGYFVRIVGATYTKRGGRAARNHRDVHTAEVGRITPHERLGSEEGDLCRRDGCRGRIEIKPVENCSCHISPPCGACVDAPLFCPDCLWEDR